MTPDNKKTIKFSDASGSFLTTFELSLSALGSPGLSGVMPLASLLLFN